jgi:hypothetical protein
MRLLRRFTTFWWEFVIGDDWRVAVGVVVALGITAAIAATGTPAWWLLPLAVTLLLYVSLHRAARG